MLKTNAEFVPEYVVQMQTHPIGNESAGPNPTKTSRTYISAAVTVHAEVSSAQMNSEQREKKYQVL